MQAKLFTKLGRSVKGDHKAKGVPYRVLKPGISNCSLVPLTKRTSSNAKTWSLGALRRHDALQNRGIKAPFLASNDLFEIGCCFKYHTNARAGIAFHSVD